MSGGQSPFGGYKYGNGAPTPPPPPGAPAGPPHAHAPSPPGATNGLAIAALVCALLGLVTCVTAPVGLALGLVALSQIKRTGQGGRGLAIAGVWIGAIITAVVVLAVSVSIVALHAHKSCSYVSSNNPHHETFQECVNNHTY